jgi:hypothetical protein
MSNVGIGVDGLQNGDAEVLLILCLMLLEFHTSSVGSSQGICEATLNMVDTNASTLQK